jgi:Fur family transcriptional regulator, ferric uptake regulator
MSHNGLHWEQVLWAAGHRVTPQRALILDVVCSADGHTTLGEIYARVRRADNMIDRSTVYRALHLFVHLGIVLAADTGDGETYYEIRKPQPHHHLVCRQCGREQEIGGPAVQTMFDEIARRHGFQVTTEHLVLFGICAICRQEEPRPVR